MLRTTMPALPVSSMASTDIPSATPAWGRSVMPRYFTIVSLQPEIFAEKAAPVILPAERKMM